MTDNNAQSYPEEMSLDEYENALSAPEVKDDPSKSINDELERTREALRVSEQSRLAALEARANESREIPATPTEPTPKELTREEIVELMEKDPLGAMEYIQTQTVRAMGAHVESRVAPLAHAALSNAERDARAKYAVEFELFGDDIKAQLETIPNRNVMTNPEAWDQLIGYVRGKTGNLEKYIEREIGRRQNAARETEQRSTGFSVTGNARSGGSGSGAGADNYYGLDATQREIADTLGQSYADYAKWMRN